MTELFGVHGLVVAVVALIVIGPRDLPKALRVVGYWVGKARGVARQFRSGFDQMVREAELEDMEKKWKAENERIMREHPLLPDADAPPPAGEAPPAEPLHVEKPVVTAAADPAPGPAPAPPREGASS